MKNWEQVREAECPNGWRRERSQKKERLLFPSYAKASTFAKALRRTGRRAGRPSSIWNGRENAPKFFAHCAHGPRRKDDDSTWLGPVPPHPGPLPKGEGEWSPVAESADDSSGRKIHGSWAGGVFGGRFPQGGASLCPGLEICQPNGLSAGQGQDQGFFAGWSCSAIAAGGDSTYLRPCRRANSLPRWLTPAQYGSLPTRFSSASISLRIRRTS